MKKGAPNLLLEDAIRRQGIQSPAGVDEAGRGPLAGPVVAAAVVLPEEWRPEFVLDDSKKMSESQRTLAFDRIRTESISWAVALASPKEIDRVNILQATMQVMELAVKRLRPAADYVLVDGNRLPMFGIPGEAVVKGDQKSLSIAAASVLAKVVRDRIMMAYDRRYPQWGFAQHKGYGTKAHLEALKEHGPCPIHRLTFKPVTAAQIK